MNLPKPIMERRRSIRVDEKLPFKIGHEHYEIEAVTINISSQGVLCAVDRDIAMMTQLKVALSLPGKDGAKPKNISARGVVVRKEKGLAAGRFFLGVYFADIKDSDRETLERFIESRLANA